MSEDATQLDACTAEAEDIGASGRCCLPAGHSGQHLAMGASGQIVAAWR